MRIKERRSQVDRPVDDTGARQAFAVTRADFLIRAGTALLGVHSLAAGAFGRDPLSEMSSRPGGSSSKDGRPGVKVERWDVVTIGNLSRNKYWGESDKKGVRPALCTCTLISGGSFRLLVDPSLADAERMAAELDRRTGLKPRDITAVFITHEHADHVAGLAHFPDSKWLAAPGVAEALNSDGQRPRKVERVATSLFDAIEVIPFPGHTRTHHGLGFECDGAAVVVAGDAVATRDFFRHRQAFFNAEDSGEAIRTMARIAAAADLIVPGHDNYFPNLR